MTAMLLTPEMDAISRRTHRMFGVSVAVHIVLMLLLSIYKQIEPQAVSLTEITWLEPGQGDGEPAGTPAMALVAPAPPHRQESGIALKEVARSEHFVREEAVGADYEPEPQDVAAAEDRLAERLANMQRQSARPAITGAAGAPGPVVGLASMGGMGIGSGLPGSGGTSSLNRGGTGGGGGHGSAPIAMKRMGTAPAPVVATIAPEQEKPAAPKRSSEGAVAQRTLAGATLLGPVADRRLLNFVQPRYPDWAKKEGVEATVRIYFVVLEDGTLKENVVVQKTSGYLDFDSNAVDALRSWRFERLPAGSAGEQWGEITFRYRLSSG